MKETRRCSVCGRFRAYDADDRFCIVCGSDALASRCECGRGFDYALGEDGPSLHCPRCGRPQRGRSEGYE